MGIVVSPHQIEAIESFRDRHTVVNSVAGSGKSTLLELAAQDLIGKNVSSKNIVVVVFSKPVRQALVNKFSSEEQNLLRIDWSRQIKTFNSIGYTMLRQYLGTQEKVYVEKNKYRSICNQLDIWEGLKTKPVHDKKTVYRVIDCLRHNLMTVCLESIQQIRKSGVVEGIFDEQWVATVAELAIREGYRQAVEERVVDFVDQIYLPSVMNLTWQYSPINYLLVDECQDLSVAKRALTYRLMHEKTKVLAVGDPRQAIFAFAGSHSGSFYQLQEDLMANQLVLPVCYRCHKKAINLVNRLFPDIPIVPRPGAPDGVVEVVTDQDLMKPDSQAYLLNKREALIISRRKEPLVTKALNLMKNGVSISLILGTEVQERLENWVDGLADINGFNLAEFEAFCAQYLTMRIEMLKDADNKEAAILRERDTYQCILTIQKSYKDEVVNIEVLKHKIEVLFKESSSAKIKLCSIHKAKGLEAEVVYILEPETLPLKLEGMTEEQLLQEENLLYVALTRAKQGIFILGTAWWLVSDLSSAKVTSVDLNTDDKPEDTANLTVDKVIQLIDDWNVGSLVELKDKRDSLVSSKEVASVFKEIDRRS